MIDVKPGRLRKGSAILMAALFALAALPVASQEDGEAREDMDEVVVTAPRILSKEEVKLRAYDIYDRVWEANVDLFKGKKKRPEMYFSHQDKGGLHGTANKGSFRIYAQSCRNLDDICAFVIAHELAHILTYKLYNRGKPVMIAGCDVPTYELIADTIGRKMAMKAGFRGLYGSYEHKCGITKYYSADMAEADQK